MLKRSDDADILEKILTKDELSVVKNAYSMYKGMEDGTHKIFLLRRINDVISMARYIDLSYPAFNQYDYDVLGYRLNNLRISMAHMDKEPSNDLSLSYMVDSNCFPLLLSSIHFLDIQNYNEINNLLSLIAGDCNGEETVFGELKSMVGPTHHILYTRVGNKKMVYNVFSNFKPGLKKKDLLAIKESCNERKDVLLDPVIQSIIDDSIYSVLHFNLSAPNNGYRLVKERKDYPER